MIIKRMFSGLSAWRSLVNCNSRISVYYSTQIKNIEVGTNISTSEPQVDGVDFLLNELNGPFSSKSLCILESNKDIINGCHILATIKSFFRFYKRRLSNPANNESPVTDEDSFRTLCSIINSNIDKLSGAEAVKLSEYLTRLKIPESSLIVQSILTRINSSINDLSIVDYYLTLYFIKKMKQNQMINKLKKNLSHKFIGKITSDFQEDNIDHISYALAFITSIYPPSKQSQLLGIFFEKLENYKKDIPPRNLVIILEAMCAMQWHPKGWIDILRKLQKQMISKADEYNSGQIRYLLLMIAEKVFTKEARNHVYYNEELVNAFVQKLINDDAGFETGLSSLKSLYYMRHKSKELLNYCCASFFERSVMNDQQIKDSEGKLLTLVSGLAAATHKSIFWKDIKNVFLNDYILNYSHKTLVILVSNLIILDFYPIHILEKIFDGKYDYSQDTYLHWTFAKIYQAVKTKKNYSGPMPTESQIESLEKLLENFVRERNEITLPLTKYLEKCLGGSQYVVSNIGTKIFHYLDHAVVFDKDKVPVPICFSINPDEEVNNKSNHIVYLENIKVPPDCRLVTISLYPNHWYFRNCDELLGLQTITESTLKGMCSVVTMKTKTWFSVPEDEKSLYLLDKISSKL